jgi:hypothetical protein
MMQADRTSRFARKLRRWWINLRPVVAFERWRYDFRARRSLIRERDRLFNEMWDAVNAEQDELKHVQIFEEYNAKIARPNHRLDDLRVRQLEEYATNRGLEFDWFAVNAPSAAPGSEEWLVRARARDHLARVVSEEKWRRGQRWANIIIPILSLLVALAALLTTQTCGRAIQISIPNP